MFTDVVGFTSLGQADEELALELLEEHREIVRSMVAKYGGKEVKTIGDAHYFRGRYQDGVEHAKKVIDMDPSYLTIYPSLVNC